MVHKGCGGMVFMNHDGTFWCMNCDCRFSSKEEVEMIDEVGDDEIREITGRLQETS